METPDDAYLPMQARDLAMWNAYSALCDGDKELGLNADLAGKARAYGGRGMELAYVGAVMSMRRCMRSPLAAALPTPPCEVKPSSTHGLGSLATRDIPVGGFITMYPCDGVATCSLVMVDRRSQGFDGRVSHPSTLMW